LAIPYTRYDQTYRSSLVVMHVDAAAGFSSLGEVVHDDLVEGAPCDVVADEGCSFSPDMRRGVFIEDWVYSISGAGVAVNAVSDLVTPVATVMLPQELPPVAGVE
jgi:hypothetical protein